MKKKITIAVAAALALALIIALVMTLVLCGGDDPIVYSYDYFAEDLSQYIDLADGDYKGYDLTVKMTEVTDALVDEWIMHVLCENRIDEPTSPGKSVPLSVGDVLEAWCRSYIIDENGNEIELDVTAGELGKSGVGDKKITIGEGLLPLGVESALLGIVIADYPEMDEVSLKGGDVISEDDVLYISYSVTTPTGKKSYTSVRVDLSRTDLDAEFGDGFRDAFVGKSLTESKDGKLSVEKFTAIGEDGRYAYDNIRVDYAYPKDAGCITVSGKLPHGYSDYDLACETVYYDIFPEYFTAYDTPELDAKFISETLKITDEMLAEYEGDNTVEQYRAYVKAELIRESEEELRAIGEEAMWYHYNEAAKVISYPNDAVMAIYTKDLEEIELLWQNYRDEYPSLDAFVYAYFSMPMSTDWRAALKADAEAEVKEKLIFYYVIRKENLLPTEEKYRELFDAVFDEFVVYYMDGKTAEDYDSIDAYNAARAEAEVAVMDYYGEDFFRHQVYYDYALDALLGFANLQIIN